MDWQPFDYDCLHCGAGAEVLTCSGKENVAYDGEKARCESCGCPGVVQVDEDGSGWVNWHDEPGCECAWCVAHGPWGD